MITVFSFSEFVRLLVERDGKLVFEQVVPEVAYNDSHFYTTKDFFAVSVEVELFPKRWRDNMDAIHYLYDLYLEEVKKFSKSRAAMKVEGMGK